MLKMNIVFTILILCFFFTETKSQIKRDFLSGKYNKESLQNILIPQKEFHPFPVISEREAWIKVDEKLQNAYIKNGKKYLNKPWDQLPASVFLEFKRNGNRTRYEGICFERRKRLMSLVLAEVFENKGRFLDEIANGIWLVCEETYWGIPAHVGAQKKGTDLPDITDPTIDLFAAETGAMLAYINYLIGGKLNEVSPLITERIYLEENRRIITPYLKKNAWWKTGTNNWNPWVNSNIIAVILFLEKDNLRRTEAVYNTMQSVDFFLNNYPGDGGCDEGPGYWYRAAGSLFDYLELLYSATDRKVNLFNEPLLKKMGQFIYKAWIKDDYYINFADASSKNKPDAGLVYRFGKKINDTLMMGFGALLSRQSNFNSKASVTEYGSLNVTLPNIFIQNELLHVKPVEPFLRDIWFPDLQVMASRSYQDNSEGFYLAAKGGHNAESHNHNDVGSFVVYYSGNPVLVDVGVGTYTSQTFGSKRYEIWTMQSQYHNLPTINGVQQKDGKEFRAENVSYSNDLQKASFSLELSKCYPPEAMLNSLKRNIELFRGAKVVISDEYFLKEWKAPVSVNLMTRLKTDCSIPGKIILTGFEKKFEIRYNKNKFIAAVEKIEINDARLSPVWGNKLFRIVLTVTDKKLKDNYSIELSDLKK